MEINQDIQDAIKILQVAKNNFNKSMEEKLRDNPTDLDAFRKFQQADVRLDSMPLSKKLEMIQHQYQSGGDIKKTIKRFKEIAKKASSLHGTLSSISADFPSDFFELEKIYSNPSLRKEATKTNEFEILCPIDDINRLVKAVEIKLNFLEFMGDKTSVKSINIIETLQVVWSDEVGSKPGVNQTAEFTRFASLITGVGEDSLRKTLQRAKHSR